MTADESAGPDGPVEIELKLGLTPEAMEELIASPVLRERAQSTVRTTALHAVYYDTEDRRLRARKAALRVRGVDGRHVQTLKSARRGDVAYAQRGEWEVELAGPEPAPSAFADPEAHDLMGLLLPEQLRPVFETRVRRRTLVLGWTDADGSAARIEAAFDDGAVLTNGKELPVCELELELLQGDPVCLLALAETLRGLVPLRIEPLEKAARGWLLATGEPPAAVKAADVHLDPGQTVDDALHVILSAALRHWLDNEPAARDGRDPEGVHQLRVALRRLRSAFSLLAPALGEGPKERWGQEMRWLLGGLGPARDLDVLLGELLPPLESGRVDGPALQAFREVALARRAEAQTALCDILASQRYADLAFHFAAWVARHGWREGADVDLRLGQRQSIVPFAAAVLERRHRKVIKRGRGFAGLAPAERHQVRIALKKLRYGIEFFADLFPEKAAGRLRKAAARMQDRLGHLNDVDVASRLAHELVDPLPADAQAKAAAIGGGQLVGWYAHQVTSLEPETVAAWKAFRKLEPDWGQGR
jgi:triphosphatase